MKTSSTLSQTVLASLIVTLGSFAWHPPIVGGAEPPGGALSRYLANDDASYEWKKRRDGSLGKARYAELIVASQTWRKIAWKHQLFLIKPSTCRDDAQHALLYITGGAWRDELEEPAKDGDSLPRQAEQFAALAEQLKSPVAVLLQVPQQPIFEGKYEDQIIAYTFDKYLETGDDTWPLLLPMVKSAVRAMDTVEAFGKSEWALDIKSFTVTGASKRGWTTWLTGAADKRAKVIAPMVIDVLNMGQHLKHQSDVWGKFSNQIDDYTERNLHEKMQTEQGRELLKIVDPFNYRAALTQPKLILIGTNDRYWPIDSLNLYWDKLQGEKHILYVPNNGHGLNDLGRVMGSIAALHQRAIDGKPLPKLDWNFKRSADDKTATLSIHSEPRPRRVQIWKATSKIRDFREVRWKSTPAKSDGNGGFTHQLEIPDTGYAAMFGEAVYDGATFPFFLSTNVTVVGEEQVDVGGE